MNRHDFEVRRSRGAGRAARRRAPARHRRRSSLTSRSRPQSCAERCCDRPPILRAGRLEILAVRALRGTTLIIIHSIAKPLGPIEAAEPKIVTRKTLAPAGADPARRRMDRPDGADRRGGPARSSVSRLQNSDARGPGLYRAARGALFDEGCATCTRASSSSRKIRPTLPASPSFCPLRPRHGALRTGRCVRALRPEALQVAAQAFHPDAVAVGLVNTVINRSARALSNVGEELDRIATTVFKAKGDQGSRNKIYSGHARCARTRRREGLEFAREPGVA